MGPEKIERKFLPKAFFWKNSLNFILIINLNKIIIKIIKENKYKKATYFP